MDKVIPGFHLGGLGRTIDSLFDDDDDGKADNALEQLWDWLSPWDSSREKFAKSGGRRPVEEVTAIERGLTDTQGLVPVGGISPIASSGNAALLQSAAMSNAILPIQKTYSEPNKFNLEEFADRRDVIEPVASITRSVHVGNMHFLSVNCRRYWFSGECGDTNS